MKKIYIFLFISIALSFFLRFYLIPTNLFFGPEQGNDFLQMKQIAVDYNPTLIGAQTDIPGIFHGPIYYYIGAFFFFFTRGNPVGIAASLIFLNCLTVIPLYYLGKELKSKRLGILAVILFIFSFETLIYPRWLSSHPLVLPLSTLFFLCLIRFLKGQKNYLLGVAILFGLIGQAEFLNFLFLTIMGGVTIVLFYKQFFKQSFLFFISCLFLLIIFSFGTYILFEVRNQFLMTKSLIRLFSGHAGYHLSFLIALQNAWAMFAFVFTKTITPISLLTGIIVFCIALTLLVYQSMKQNKYLWLIVIWILTPFIVLILLHNDILEQFFVLSIPAMLLMTALILDWIWEKQLLLAVFLIICFLSINLYAWHTYVPTNQYVFFQSTQPDISLSTEQQAIQWIYNQAKGQPFAVHAYTIPYNYEDGWTYLFWYYGQQYGYQPQENGAKSLFLIIQKDTNTGLLNMWKNDQIHSDSVILASTTIGVFHILHLK